MKACKLCELFDRGSASSSAGDKGSDKAGGKGEVQAGYCSHRHGAAAAAAAADTLSSFNLLPPNLRDVFLAAQLLRGYYQPAGPLISPHLLPPGPGQPPPKTIPPPLDSDPLQQPPPSSASAASDSDNDVIITGTTDMASNRPAQAPYRYGPQGPSIYSRPMHQMHCPPPYASGYYAPYPPPPQEMCYPYPQGPPYYPPKVYPGAPPPFARRYGYGYPPGPGEMYDQPPQNAPPPPSGQMVPAGPSGPPHMEHYPGPPAYYPGYSPNITGHYARGLQPPYLDSSPYQSQCPCPMQSCPKNVHTGPLIGSSKTGKGPVNGHPLIATQQASAPPASSTTSTPSKIKSETFSPKAVCVKPEKATPPEMTASTSSSSSSTSAPASDQKVAMAPAPNYSLNARILEPPENSISPARGSTGPTDGPVEYYTPRRPRIGKSMERERLMSAAFVHSHHEIESSATVEMMRNIKTEIKEEQPIKQERVEIEEILSSEEEKMEIESISSTTTAMAFTTTTTVSSPQKKLPFTIDALVSDDSHKRKQTDEDSDCCVVRGDTPEAPVKRRKLLADSVQAPKKSPPNSYKSLIKQATFKNYLNESEKGEEEAPVADKKEEPPKRKRRRKTLRPKKKAVLKIKKRMIAIPKNLRKKRKVRKARKAKPEVEIVDMTTEVEIKKEPQEEAPETVPKTEEVVAALKQEMDEALHAAMEPDETSSTILPETGTSTPTSQMTNVDVTIDMVAKGYFSEPDILSSISRKRLKRLKHESRSKSEQSREKQDKLTKLLKEKARALKEKKKTERKEKKRKDEPEPEAEPEPEPEPPKGKKTKPRPKKGKKRKEKTEEDNNNVVKIDEDAPLQEILNITKKTKKKAPKKDVPAEQPERVPTPPLPPPPPPREDDPMDLISDPDTVNNNRLAYNNNKGAFQPCQRTGQKRAKSRFKFGSRKRHRAHHTKETEEVIIPRRVNSIPKWCNGWSWQGRSFQAKIFLNSDDPPVLRTCYPAMVHQGGDVLRPRDCVLLRAGNKRTELPYVAKIASLWENPEDGEMMVSLLWYYRPEHTEQGRQPADNVEEVFASRHKDHNSVACIEDKCYVLTFNEYCRYRRLLKSVEDNVVETQSIVPKLNRENPRQPPLHTAPDLVMFCRKVYEFRLKRLAKQPN